MIKLELNANELLTLKEMIENDIESTGWGRLIILTLS